MNTVDAPVPGDMVELLDACIASCQLVAEQEEGPYRRGQQPHRRDVTEDRAGSPMRLGLRLRTQDGVAVARAEVEIWHCDAEGRYSGYPPNEPGAEVDPSPQLAEYPVETFLRGRQTSDEAGDVEFRTIYPGWYPGRTVHIHLMIHTSTRRYVSQLYLPEGVTTEIFGRDPYRDHGLPDTTHETDDIFPTGGQPAVLDVHPQDDIHVGTICLLLPDSETA